MVWKNLRKPSLLAFIFLFGAIAASAQTAPPRIFFTDLTSGPNTGGESSGGFSGAYVTIYGNYFGTSQGSSGVTLNGANCLRVVSWGTTWLWYQRIVVQLGSSCASGSLAVQTSAGTSNSITFTVRSGNIYFVSPSGNDSAAGSFAAPWKTLKKATTTVGPGDIAYARAGVVQTGQDNYGATIIISGTNGTATNPIAILNYPGEVPTVSCTGGASRCLGNYPNGMSYWTIAGFLWQLPSGSESIYFGSDTNIRFLANDVSCPTGDGSTGCVTTASDGVPFADFLGNTIHDTGCPGSMATGPCGDTQKTYHAFYWGDLQGTLSHDINIGWNDVHNVYGCRGIQIHPQDGFAGKEAYNLQVHDNLIYNVRCDAINMANVNPSKGAISVYNNVMYHVGTGPDPSGQAANYTCVNVYDGNGSPSAAADVYNNTCYDGGSRGASEGDAGAFSLATSLPVRYTNNLAYELSGEAYLTDSTTKLFTGSISGSNNAWYGLGNGPSQTTANITVNPLLLSITLFDFRLQLGSPLIGAGSSSHTSLTDFTGAIRPSPPSVGAYEYASATTVPAKPNPPTNLKVTVQ